MRFSRGLGRFGLEAYFNPSRHMSEPSTVDGSQTETACTLRSEASDTFQPKPFNLPLELWVATFDIVRAEGDIAVTKLIRTPPPDTKTLREIVQVSRTFQALAEPFLWERVKLDGGLYRFPPDRVLRTLGLLNKNPDRKKWIKYLTLEKWNFTTPVDIKVAESQSVWNAFLELPNLIALRVFHTVAPPELFTHLETLPKLRAFSTFAFQVEPSSEASHGAPDTYPNIRTVILRGVRGNSEPMVKAVVHPGLERLLHGSSFASFVHTQMSLHTFDQLREYHMVEPSILDLRKFFDVALALPILTHLRIDMKRRRPSPDEQKALYLKHLALPTLTYLSGPLWLLTRLVPGRPVEGIAVRHLGISINSDEKELFKQLASGSTPVKSLSLEASSWIHLELGDVSELFPALEDLTLRNRDERIAQVRSVTVRTTQLCSHYSPPADIHIQRRILSPTPIAGKPPQYRHHFSEADCFVGRG